MTVWPASRAADQVDLAFQEFGIGGDRRMAAGDRGVAAAIEAQLGAERYVQIKRNRGVSRQRHEPALIGRSVDLGAELHGRRIAGVTRPPPVQIFEPSLAWACRTGPRKARMIGGSGRDELI